MALATGLTMFQSAADAGSRTITAPTAQTGTAVNLIANGSFENPDIWRTAPFEEFDAGSTAIPGWTAGGNSVDLTGENYWTAEDGDQSLDLAGSTSGSVSQAVATTAGTSYLLSWYLAGNTNCGQAVKTMDVSWDGAVIDALTFDTTGHSNSSMGWVLRQILVKASGTSSVVTFADATPDASECGATLDNVSLTTADLSPTVALSSSATGATGVAYAAQFSPSSALSAGTGTLTLTAPTGTALPASIADVYDITTGQDLGDVTGGKLSNGGSTGTWRVPAPIPAGHLISVSLEDVTNPAAGTYSLSITTSAQSAAIRTASYRVTEPQAVSAAVVSFAQPPLQNASDVTYPVQFTTSSTGALQAGYGKITLTAPKGTVLPATITDLFDATVQADFGQLTGGVLSDGGATGTWTVADTIPAGHVIDLTLSGVTSPVAGTYQLGIVTSSDQAAAGARYAILDPTKIPHLTGAISYSGGAVAGSIVQACSPATCVAAPAQTDGAGDYALYLPAVGHYTVTAFAPTSNAYGVGQGTAQVTAAAGADTANITLPDLNPPPSGVIFNGQSGTVPTVNWSSPASMSVPGCTSGVGVAVVSSVSTITGEPVIDLGPMTESPSGSGTYSTTVPAQYPSHGTATVNTQTECSQDTALLPSSGPVSGGTAVQLTGKGFTGATAVKFGSKPAANFTVASDSQIDAVVPAGSGTVPVSVVTPEGTISSATLAQYTYLSVASVSPARGPVAGGTKVTITGSGLADVEAVYFGSAAATNVDVISGTKITAATPAGTGSVAVTVLTGDGGQSGAGTASFGYGAAGVSRGAVAPRTVLPGPASATAPTVDAAGPVRPADAAEQFEAVNKWQEKLNIVADMVHDMAESCESGKSAGSAFRNALNNALLKAQEDFGQAQAWYQAFGGIAIGGWGDLATFYVKFAFEAEGAISLPALVGGGVLLYTLYELAESGTGLQDLEADLDCARRALPSAPDFTCNPFGWCIPAPTRFPVRIDPSGTIADTNGNPVAGATVTLLQSADKAGPFTAPASGSPIMDPSVNPETSDSNGLFHWDAFAGWYQVTASKVGCHAPGDLGQTTVWSPVFQIPPPKVGLVLTLTCPGEKPPAVPSITGLGDAYGPAAGGAELNVQGNGFTASSRVTVGAKKATAVRVISSSEILVTTPAGAGTVAIRVKTAGGTSAASTADRYTYLGVPVVKTLSPRSGPASGGTIVTITGSGLAAGDQVMFGPVPAESATIVSGTRLLAISPPGAGQAAVRVNDVDGESAVVRAVIFNYPLKPAFTSVATVSATLGRAFSFTIRVKGFPVPVIMRSGALPRGLVFKKGKNGTATISGTPSVAGRFTVHLKARNSAGTARQALVITVNNTREHYTGGVREPETQVQWMSEEELAQTPSVPEDVRLPAKQLFGEISRLATQMTTATRSAQR